MCYWPDAKRDMRLITSRNDVMDSCYCEFYGGDKVKGCWLKNSVYIEGYAFRLISDAFENNIADFDEYSEYIVKSKQWKLIKRDLKRMIAKIRPLNNIDDVEKIVYMGLFYSEDIWYNNNLKQIKRYLIKMVDDLCAWGDKTIKEEGAFVFYGL